MRGGDGDKTQEREGKWGNCDAFIEITYHSLRGGIGDGWRALTYASASMPL